MQTFTEFFKLPPGGNDGTWKEGERLFNHNGECSLKNNTQFEVFPVAYQLWTQNILSQLCRNCLNLVQRAALIRQDNKKMKSFMLDMSLRDDSCPFRPPLHERVNALIEEERQINKNVLI
jgi:hypothetical protein